MRGGDTNCRLSQSEVKMAKLLIHDMLVLRQIFENWALHTMLYQFQMPFEDIYFHFLMSISANIGKIWDQKH